MLSADQQKAVLHGHLRPLFLMVVRLVALGDLLLPQLVHAVHHVSHFRVLSPGLREGKDTDDGDWIGVHAVH